METGEEPTSRKIIKRTFLICPVRGHEMSETEEAVKKLEGEGWTVHWPPRDTDQNDPHGYRICKDNRQAIYLADAVHIIWDGKSQGCLFDLGIAFALGKEIIIISLPDEKDDNGKSFQKMIREWAGKKGW